MSELNSSSHPGKGVNDIRPELDGPAREVTQLQGETAARKQAEQKVRHLNSVLNATRKVSQLINRESDRDRLLTDICTALISTRGYFHAWIALQDENGQVIACYQSGLGDDFCHVVNLLTRGEFTYCARQALAEKKVFTVTEPIRECIDCSLTARYEDRGALTIRLEYAGRIFGVLSVSTPQHFVEDGEEHLLLAEVADDIAFALHGLEQEAARNQYEAQLALHRRIASTIPHPMSFIDCYYCYRMVNDSYAQLYGVTFDQIIDHPVAEFCDQNLFETEIKPYLDRCLAGETVSYELWLDFPEKGRRCMYMEYFPFWESEGNIGGVVSQDTDITDRKRTEESLRRYAERLEMLHEIDQAILEAQLPEAVIRAALFRLRRLIPYARAGVAELNIGAGIGWDLFVLSDEGESGLTRPYPIINAGRIVEALQQGQSCAVQDIAILPERSPLEEALLARGFRAYISVPLIAWDELIGALNLAFKTTGLVSDHIEIVQEVGASLAVALRQARLYKQVQEESWSKSELLREVNHRVSNNLISLLGILAVEGQHARQRELEAVIEVLARLTGRVESLAAVHQMLSRVEWSPVSLSDLAGQIIEAALDILPPDKYVEVNVVPSPVVISARQAGNLALIFYELGTNTIKHGLEERKQGRIALQIQTEEDWIEMIYRDDGPGYPEAVLAGREHNVGLTLLQHLTRNLGELRLSNDGGAVTALRFRLPESKAGQE